MPLPIAVRIVGACSALLIPLVPATSAIADEAPSGGSLLPSPGTPVSDKQRALRSAKEAQLEEFLGKDPRAKAALASVDGPDAARIDAASVGGFVSKVLPLVTQKQAYPYYCIPASARAMLSRFMPASQLPSQITLANEMGTTPSGTLIGAAPDSLNWHLPGPFWYVADDAAASANTLWNRTVFDVGTSSATLMPRVLFGYTPYRHTGSASGHAIVLRGYSYSTADGSESRAAHFWDPFDNGSYPGGLAETWNSVNRAGRWMVW